MNKNNPDTCNILLCKYKPLSEFYKMSKVAQAFKTIQKSLALQLTILLLRTRNSLTIHRNKIGDVSGRDFRF